MTSLTVTFYGKDEDELYPYEVKTPNGKTLASGFCFSPEEAVDQVVIDLLESKDTICNILEVLDK